MPAEMLKYINKDSGPLLDNKFKNKIYRFCESHKDCYTCPLSYATGFMFSIGCYVVDGLGSLIALNDKLSEAISEHTKHRFEHSAEHDAEYSAEHSAEHSA